MLPACADAWLGWESRGAAAHLAAHTAGAAVYHAKAQPGRAVAGEGVGQGQGGCHGRSGISIGQQAMITQNPGSQSGMVCLCR